MAVVKGFRCNRRRICGGDPPLKPIKCWQHIRWVLLVSGYTVGCSSKPNLVLARVDDCCLGCFPHIHNHIQSYSSTFRLYFLPGYIHFLGTQFSWLFHPHLFQSAKPLSTFQIPIPQSGKSSQHFISPPPWTCLLQKAGHELHYKNDNNNLPSDLKKFL